MTRADPGECGAEAIRAPWSSDLPHYSDAKARVTRDFPDVLTGRL